MEPSPLDPADVNARTRPKSLVDNEQAKEILSTPSSLPVPALLPAFDPLSSSPFINRPLKRTASQMDINAFYPSPLPTSSLGISSSPPQLPSARPGLTRTVSALSERAPLASVPSITLPEDGEPVLFGRSSNSSDYQLSANRLISRIHLRAVYTAPEELFPAKVTIECLGWNGAKIHCKGQVFEQKKGDTFMSENEGKDIMIDVQDCRVILSWPTLTARPITHSPSADSTSTWNEDSPLRRARPLESGEEDSENLPPKKRKRVTTPDSPSYHRSGLPLQLPTSTTDFYPSDSFVSHAATVVVYEDEPEDDSIENNDVNETTKPLLEAKATSVVQPKSSPLSILNDDSFSDNENDGENEENDPIITSFGPQGDNLLPRLATFSTHSPGVAQGPSVRASTPVIKTEPEEQPLPLAELPSNAVAISNHVINQLAYSRLASTPLTTLYTNLPAELRKPNPGPSSSDHGSETNQDSEIALIPVLSKRSLTRVLETIPCVGEVKREGKDAAGKALESEFYYIPDNDRDEMRRGAVQGLKKPSLRSCRKVHKVCSLILQ
jgi:hypothetical protein